MLANGLPIFGETMKLVKIAVRLCSDFPKKYKYTLGDEMAKTAMALLRHIRVANKCKDVRASVLDRFLGNFDYFNDLVRIAVEEHCISIKQQAQIAELAESIGKQANGWRKSS